MRPGFLIAGAVLLLSLMASWKITLAVVVGAAAVGTTLLYRHQGKLLYIPSMPSSGLTRSYVLKPDAELIVNEQPFRMTYEDVHLVAQDGVKLHAWFVQHPEASPRAPTMVYFHGNAGNISHRLPNVSELVFNVRCNVFMVEYRGYGESEGVPSEKGIQLDTHAAMQYLLSRDSIDRSRIIVFGRSLGGAAAIYLASQYNDQVAAVIVENSFTSIADMVDVVMPALRIFKPLITERWLSVRAIPKITAPIMFISGSRDELVPPHMMKTLHDAAVNSRYRELNVVEGGTHNETWTKPGYYHQILIFLYRALGGEAAW